MIKFDDDPTFTIGYFHTDRYEGEFVEDEIEISVLHDCGSTAYIYLKIEEWDEIVRRAKMFRDRRIAREAKGESR